MIFPCSNNFLISAILRNSRVDVFLGSHVLTVFDVMLLRPRFVVISGRLYRPLSRYIFVAVAPSKLLPNPSNWTPTPRRTQSMTKQIKMDKIWQTTWSPNVVDVVVVNNSAQTQMISRYKPGAVTSSPDLALIITWPSERSPDLASCEKMLDSPPPFPAYLRVIRSPRRGGERDQLVQRGWLPVLRNWAGERDCIMTVVSC